MTGFHFLSPLLLLSAIPLAGLIVLLYLLKLKRRDLVVPSVFLWRKAIEDVTANAPFQRLRKNLLLILQLLALLLVVFSLANPVVTAKRAGGKSTVIVLDASASMLAEDEPGSRFAKARRMASRIVDGMERGDSCAIVVAGARAWVALPFSSDRRAANRVLQTLGCTHAEAPIRDALLLAQSLCVNRTEPVILVISDGAFPPLDDVPGAARVRFSRVGQRNENAAIVAFEASRSARGQDEAFLRIANHGAAREGVVSITLEDRLVLAERVSLAPSSDRVFTFGMRLPSPGLLRAELDVTDDLAVDNVAYAFGGPAAGLKVLVVTPGNLFLEQGLLVLPEVEVHRAATLTAEEQAAAASSYDLVVFDRVDPPGALSRGAYLMISADGPGAPAMLASAYKTARITSWERDHPVCRHVNLSLPIISAGRELVPQAEANVLARCGTRPVLVALDEAGLRALSVGFSLLDSDLPLRVGFPVFLGNAVNWLTAPSARQRARVVRPGTLLRFAAAGDATTALLSAPGVRWRRLELREGQVTVAETALVGAYRLQMGEETRRWAVDLRSPTESDLEPAKALELSGRQVPAGIGPPVGERRLWPWLALVTLAILLFEWRIYHRGT